MCKEITMNNMKQMYSVFEDDISREIFKNRMLYNITSEKQYIQNVIYLNPNTASLIDQMKSKEKLAIWGAGMYGRFLKNAFEDLPFVCYIDNFASKQNYCGLEVLKFEDFLQSYKDTTIVIATKLFHEEIYNQLKEAGVEDRNIINVGKVWEKMTHSQYFDLPQLESYNLSSGIFVDGGSYDGISCLDYLERFGGVKHAYVWEPDPKNRVNVEKTLVENKISYSLIDKAMWDKKEVLYFNLEKTRSAIDEKGTIKVETGSIDGLINEHVSFIKMDVEGAEYNALLGAKKTICRDKPILAISVYHKAEDIIEIPAIINSFNSNYRFYLRHYSFGESETILYAIDREKNRDDI